MNTHVEHITIVKNTNAALNIAFLKILLSVTGRLITIGTGNEYKFGSTGAVVYNAARYAVAGASCSLNQEMSVHGVRVITIHTESIPSEKLFLLPKIPR